jgi:hypothetical protein
VVLRIMLVRTIRGRNEERMLTLRMLRKRWSNFTRYLSGFSSESGNLLSLYRMLISGFVIFTLTGGSRIRLTKGPLNMLVDLANIICQLYRGSNPRSLPTAVEPSTI